LLDPGWWNLSIEQLSELKELFRIDFGEEPQGELD